MCRLDGRGMKEFTAEHVNRALVAYTAYLLKHGPHADPRKAMRAALEAVRG